MSILDGFIETSAKVADQVAKVAGEYIDKGKDKISQLSLENDLAKAQKQLGALVYALHKTGEENQELLNQYIEDVKKIELQLAAFKKEEETAKEPAEEATLEYQTEEESKICAQCGTIIGSTDAFCRSCGANTLG